MAQCAATIVHSRRDKQPEKFAPFLALSPYAIWFFSQVTSFWSVRVSTFQQSSFYFFAIVAVAIVIVWSHFSVFTRVCRLVLDVECPTSGFYAMESNKSAFIVRHRLFSIDFDCANATKQRSSIKWSGMSSNRTEWTIIKLRLYALHSNCTFWCCAAGAFAAPVKCNRSKMTTKWAVRSSCVRSMQDGNGWS